MNTVLHRLPTAAATTAMAAKISQTPVDLVIRFTTAIPDVVLTIASASLTSTLSLKQRIRQQLPPEAASSRLRLIAAGKVLLDTSSLAASISIPPPPPPAAREHAKADLKGKGKAPLRASPPPQPNARVYVHCSIGDPLSAEDLAAEATAAAAADEALLSQTQPKTARDDGEQSHRGAKTGAASAPQGFDRLLNAGFNQAEIATLRTQFLAIQSHTHTPDTMPTGDELRALEDRWLDNDAGADARAGLTGGDGLGGFGAEDGGLDDMLWGNLIGFFWPIAAVCWLSREEGVWTRRRRIAVLSGMLVNLTFGFLRLTN